MMPIVDVDKLVRGLTPAEGEIVRACFLKNGKFRATKPKDGYAAYVWRMTAFFISDNPQHHCMPVTADFDVPIENYGARREWCFKVGDHLSDLIVQAVPATQQHGTRRWARAFGVVGGI